MFLRHVIREQGDTEAMIAQLRAGHGNVRKPRAKKYERANIRLQRLAAKFEPNDLLNYIRNVGRNLNINVWFFFFLLFWLPSLIILTFILDYFDFHPWLFWLSSLIILTFILDYIDLKKKVEKVVSCVKFTVGENAEVKKLRWNRVGETFVGEKIIAVGEIVVGETGIGEIAGR